MWGNREKRTKEQLISKQVYEGFMNMWKSQALKMEKGEKKINGNSSIVKIDGLKLKWITIAVMIIQKQPSSYILSELRKF